MRSIRLLAVATTVLVLGSACGGDDPPTGNGNENEAPVAAFTAPTNCVAGTPCTFTDASSDDAAVTAWNWDFDGNLTTAEGTTATANYTFPAAGTASVRLIVTDAEGLADTVTNNVTVAAVPVENILPVADFELVGACTEGTPCGFHSLSTDADGTITTLAWDFGDVTAPAAGVDVTHTFGAAGTYDVTLTVTDNLGGVAEVTLPITVAPAASQDCTTTGTVVDCDLTVNVRSTITFSVVSESCDFSGNRLQLTLPAEAAQVVFFNLCNQTPGATKTIQAAGGAGNYVFEAGTVFRVHFVRGAPGPTDPPASDPGIQVDGTSPNWTLNIDDGGNAGTAGEPDFNDAVISITATAAP